MFQITCSIVLYNTEDILLRQAVDSIQKTQLSVKLYLVDNSQTDRLRTFANQNLIDYTYNNKNIGYGAAHNLAIKKASGTSNYHLVLNPDVTFNEGVLESIFSFMENNKNVGQLMPKVLYKNGDLQKLCKLLPTPLDLFGRRFLKNNKWAQQRNRRYELEDFKYDKQINLPNLSGCFMFLRSSILQEVGGFDERYFIYLEDVDLTRRIHRLSRTVFFPEASIYHGYEKESYSNPALLKHHINSAISYFNKWGWFFDKERSLFNKDVFKQLGA